LPAAKVRDAQVRPQQIRAIAQQLRRIQLGGHSLIPTIFKKLEFPNRRPYTVKLGDLTEAGPKPHRRKATEKATSKTTRKNKTQTRAA
jgi:hypothetical protein